MSDAESTLRGLCEAFMERALLAERERDEARAEAALWKKNFDELLADAAKRSREQREAIDLLTRQCNQARREMAPEWFRRGHGERS